MIRSGLSLACLVLASELVRADTPSPLTLAYHSPAVGRTLKCQVILPAGYDQSEKRYPVLYLLHGYSGDYLSWGRHGAAEAAAPYELIVVLPDGGNSWWINWAEDDRGRPCRWEDAVVKDLIPMIDARFRTIAARDGRAINGLSMGGYGALVLGLRNPDLFCTIGSHSGALDMARGHARRLRATPEARVPARNPSERVNPAIRLEDFDSQDERTPAGRIFSSVEQCQAHDPYHLVANVPLEQRPHIYLDCGTEDSLYGLSQEFARLLLEQKIPFTYAQSPGEHRSAYWRRELRHAIAVQHEILRRQLAARAAAGR